MESCDGGMTMKIIGLTGGIASGKSTVAKILEDFGAVVIDADQLARQAVMPGEPAYQEIRREFGEGVIGKDGLLDRSALGAAVFADPGLRKRLEEITHPQIRKLAEKRLLELKKNGAKAAFYMAPLLYEVGLDNKMDEVWVVYVKEETQLRRLVERDRFSEAEAKRRIASQMPIEEKRKRAKVVIYNEGTLEETKRQVEKAWKSQF